MKFKLQTSTEEGQGSFFYSKFISLKLHYSFVIIYLLFVSYLKYFFETPSDNVPITKYECIDAKSSIVQLCKLEKCHTNKCIEVSSICHFDILSSHVLLEQWWNRYLSINYAHSTMKNWVEQGCSNQQMCQIILYSPFLSPNVQQKQNLDYVFKT